MLNIFKSPLVRISLGLVMLTITMLLITDALGLVPDTKRAELKARKVIAESIAVQLSTEIAERKLRRVERLLSTVVSRNDEILSAAVRMGEGKLIAQFGGHEQHWTLARDAKSTPEQVRVPIFNGSARWGAVELSFKPLPGMGDIFSRGSSFYTAILFIALVGFIAYMMFLKRTLSELNPDSVIPDRVREALDTLAESLLIIDTDNRIIFSNSNFAAKLGLPPQKLVGKLSSSFEWEVESDKNGSAELPWLRVLAGQKLPEDEKIRLKTSHDSVYSFNVNASSITTPGGKVRGVLVTLNDITEIEKKSEELRRTFSKLEKSQREITRQNRELQILATRDPLTALLNRRSLAVGFQTLFDEAREEEEELSCIMVDIDHFKSVNDRFGHSVGDVVIKLLARILTDHSRPNDLVGRYGGEEFLLVLPGVGSDIAFGIAERIRLAVQEGDDENPLSEALEITSSFGVATLMEASESYSMMLEQADKALYSAKEQGRNRVVIWSGSIDGSAEHDTEHEPLNPEIESQIAAGTENLSCSDLNDSEAVLTSPADEALLHNLLNKDQDSFANNVLQSGRIEQAVTCAQRYDTKVAVMVIDIDALHYVSDTLGHAVNQKIGKTIVIRLKQVLKYMSKSALKEDGFKFSVSLLGFNKIVVLLMDLERSEVVPIILQRMFSVYNSPVEVEGHEFYLNSNIGVSLFPEDGKEPDSLIRNACSAMREAKLSNGRNSFRFYDDDINKRYRKRIRLEAELHRAVERDEFIVCYQPKIDLKTGVIVGMEALIRWQHSQLGMIPPDDFIPLAEQTGFIDEISQWVISTVCQQIKFWQDAGHGTVNVAVNLSPLEFRDPELGDKIIKLVADSGVPVSALEFEITETTVMQNMDTAIDTLIKLNSAGFGISVDDFGTGYSSLSYLKEFPLSKVKIDRSFVTEFIQDSSDAAIVSAIIAMSHSLGLRVIAEGVETKEQLRFLQDLHCDEMQGYLVSRPVMTKDVNALLGRAHDIRDMIVDSSGDSGSVGYQGMGNVTGMISILNDFPAPEEVIVDGESSAVGE
ncbi:EAL domain-containing protein [Amphritea sp. HPY]|uniref:EAL domain-containing protein n=1 Tax=Amphritea sp. HPY TaxID=3421652 RepID=UPI003D7CA72A